METIREHKNVVAAVIAAAGAIANFMPIPELGAWIGFGLMLAAGSYLLLDAYRVRNHVMLEAKKRNVNAESQVEEQVAELFIARDSFTHR